MNESFAGRDLTLVDFTGRWFDRTDFTGADMRHAALNGCHFKMCDFTRANLRGASLRFAHFAACDLRGADMRDCDLTGAEFGIVNTGSDNAFTDVSGVRWSEDGPVKVTFEQVTGDPT